MYVKAMLLPFRIFSKSQHRPDDHLTIITFIFNLTCAVLTVLILWISECTFFKVVGVLNGNGRVRKSGTGIYDNGRLPDGFHRS